MKDQNTMKTSIPHGTATTPGALVIAAIAAATTLAQSPLPSSLSPLSSGQGGPATPYGVCAHLYGEEFPGLDRSLALMKAAGIGMVRCDFPWKIAEKDDGSWDFARFDAVVAGAKAVGITILPILDYSHPSRPMPTEDSGPWREYVRRIVERYAADCPVFEVWNEQNGGTFCGGPPTADRYLPVLRAAFEEIRAAAPDAKVAIGGLVNSGSVIQYLEELHRLGGWQFFDILNLHPYSDMRNNPEGLLDKVLEAHRKQMDRLGGKPVWITEFGWSTSERLPGFDPATGKGIHQGGTDDKTAALWTARALGIAFAEGVEAVFHYELRALERDRFHRESHFGLVHENFVPKPAYLAFSAFTSARPAGSVQKELPWRLDGRPGQTLYFPQWTIPDREDPRIVPLPGRDAGMVWTTGFKGVRHLRFNGATASGQQQGGGATLRFFDAFGKELFPLHTEDGGYDVFVSGSPVYFAGGELEPPANPNL